MAKTRPNSAYMVVLESRAEVGKEEVWRVVQGADESELVENGSS